MRRGIFFAPFGELADPRVCAELGARAEARGWDGVFLWDHMLYDDVDAIADPWVAMAAIAAATRTVRLGAMVTPVARRRPQKLAREAATLDLLSGGRLICGLGLGGDRGGELSRFGEELDPRARAALLDAGAELLDAWWRGEEAGGVRLLPRPAQRPRIPIWFAARWPNRRPVRRAARYDGLFTIELEHPDQLAEIVAEVDALREAGSGTFDHVVTGAPGDDAAPWARAGATWWLAGLSRHATRAEAEAVIDGG